MLFKNIKLLLTLALCQAGFITAAAIEDRTIVHGTLTFNVTQAYQPQEFSKYHCLTTSKFASWLPRCMQNCQVKAAKGDGCPVDDYACHCVNYIKFSKIIEPCVFPPSLGGQGSCSLAELTAARPLVTDMCNFFNATTYGAYSGCPNDLHRTLTFLLIDQLDVAISY